MSSSSSRSNNQFSLKEAVESAVLDVLMDVCGGENKEGSTDSFERRPILRDIAKTCVSCPNKNISEDGKPYDIEIRAALSLFHRFKKRRKNASDVNPHGQTQTKHQTNQNPPFFLRVVSYLGLVRTFDSPLQFAQALCPLLEEHCSSKRNLCHHIQCSTSGIICIVTPQRGEVLRQAGKLPCPQCIQWCKGEKGLWWHQQQKHGSEHSIATASAAKQRDVLALIPYNSNPPRAVSADVKAFRTSSSTSTNSSVNGDVVHQNDPQNSRQFQHCYNAAEDPLEFIKNGKLEAVKEFVKGGYDPSDALDRKGASPLMWAAGGGHLTLVKYLVEECGCSPHEGQRGKRSFAGRTALHWAARNGHVSVVKYLVDHCQVSLEATTIDGTTAFAWASWQAHQDVMEFLNERGANVNARNSYGCNAALWCAQGQGSADTMRRLKSIGCEMALLNSNGHGIFHKAAQRGNEEIVKWVLNSVLLPIFLGGSNDERVVMSHLQLIGPDSDGCSPSDLAGMEGYEELAAFIASKELQCVETAYNAIAGRNTEVTFPKWLSLADKFSNGSCSCCELLWEPLGGVRRMKHRLSKLLCS